MSGKTYAIKTEVQSTRAKTFDFRKQKTMYGGKRIAEGDTLKPHAKWDDGRPETELNFKFYRQATNKIVGLSDPAAAFLRGFFASRP